VVIGTEQVRFVEGPAGQARPIRFVDALGVDFLLPENLQFLAFRVVLKTRQTDEHLVLRPRRGVDPFYEVASGPNAHDRSGFWRHV